MTSGQNGSADLMGRQTHLDILRVVATFAVIVIHVASSARVSVMSDSEAWQVFNFYDGISRWCVPIFVMISGALFLSKDRPLGVIYRKHILRIATAFIFWSLIYVLVMFFEGYPLEDCIATFFSGYWHLWFLPMIIGLYMIVPFLRKFVGQTTLLKYFIILAFVFAILIPQAVFTLSLVNADYADAFYHLLDRSQFCFVLGYTLYFVLGYYLSNVELSKTASRLIYGVGIVGFVATVVLFGLTTARFGIDNAAVDNFALGVFFESVTVFVWFKNSFAKFKFSERVKKIFRVLAKYSFGAYLVHILILMALQSLGLELNAMVMVPLFSVIIFGGSFLFSALLHQIPIVNKYLV